MGCHGRYTAEKVTYPSHGETITGILYLPKDVANPPGVVVLGPYSFVKEQAPLQYATRLADEGYAALIFDPRTVGESTGQPRRLENPKMKNEDVVSGLDYLAGRGDVDAKRLFLVGVCQGGPECLDVASYDDRVVAVASVTGYYRDHETDVWMICTGCVNIEPGVDVGSLKMPTPEQGEALYQARIERARKAKELYEKTGQVTYQPLVDPKAADPDVGSLAGLPGPVAWAWYGPWTLKGFENRYAVMSDLDHFGYSTVPGVAKLTKPALVIHGDNCMNAPAAKRHFESIPTKNKKLIWDNANMFNPSHNAGLDRNYIHKIKKAHLNVIAGWGIRTPKDTSMKARDNHRKDYAMIRQVTGVLAEDHAYKAEFCSGVRNITEFQILGLPFFTAQNLEMFEFFSDGYSYWHSRARSQVSPTQLIEFLSPRTQKTLQRLSLNFDGRVEPGQRNLPKPKPITPQQIKHFTNLSILEVDSSCFYSHVLHHNKNELIVEQETYLVDFLPQTLLLGDFPKLERVRIDAPIRYTMSGSNSWDDYWDNEQLAKLSAEMDVRREEFQEAFVGSGVDTQFRTWYIWDEEGW
ncbi:Alpha/Beta hydrolase protein [Fusarium sp. MPI-SDFR-AT-0072]|nr:Alpha/Beta hydrolase protein [Fusarium sp. MPI-SDFR-AT-0072]